MAKFADIQAAIKQYKKSIWFYSDPVMIALESYLQAIERNNAFSTIITYEQQLTAHQQLEIKRLFIDLYPVEKNTHVYKAWLNIVKALHPDETYQSDANTQAIADFYLTKKPSTNISLETTYPMGIDSLYQMPATFADQDFSHDVSNPDLTFGKSLQIEIHRYHGVRGSRTNPAIIALENFIHKRDAEIAFNRNNKPIVSVDQKIALTTIFTKTHPVKKSDKSYMVWLKLLPKLFTIHVKNENDAEQAHVKLRAAAKENSADFNMTSIDTALCSPIPAGSGNTFCASFCSLFGFNYTKLASSVQGPGTNP